MLPIDWNTAIRYALLVQIAEAVKPKAAYSPADQAKIQAAGYDFKETIYADDLSTDVDPHLGDVVTFGFLGISQKTGELVAVVRGTDTILEWMHDASFLMVPSPINGAHGYTEDGFTSVYKSLRVQPANGSLAARDSIRGYLDTRQATSVTVCGHSLGGALATLLTLDVALNTSCRTPTAYTYASPRTGDHIFAGAYNAAIPASYRIANRQDLVPKLPPPIPLLYEHVNTDYELIPPKNSINPTIACEHHLTSYLWLMGQRAGTSAYPLDADCKFTAPAHI